MQSDILDMDEMENEEDDSTFPAQQSRPKCIQAVSPVDSNLYEVCKRAASKLGIMWPAAQDAEAMVRVLYDSKRLPPAHPPSKQLVPADERPHPVLLMRSSPRLRPSDGACCRG